MKILCDWIDTLRQYNVVGDCLIKLERECIKHGVELLMCEPEALSKPDDSVYAYLGNRFDVTLLPLYPNLRWVQFGSVGTDRLPSHKATERGIIITNIQGVFDQSVAVHAVSLLLGSRNCIYPEDGFSRRHFEGVYENYLLACPVLILGSGSIARKTYQALEVLGFEVYLISRSKLTAKIAGYRTHSHDEIKDHNFEYPFVINLLPLNETTKGLVGSSYLSRFKRLSGYINLGRRETEDTESILRLLRFKKIDYAAWDVIRDAETAKRIKSEFGARVNLTPHIAAFHQQHWNKTTEIVVENMKHFFSGDQSLMRNRVNV